MKKSFAVIVSMWLFAVPLMMLGQHSAHAQAVQQGTPADVAARIQSQLESRYAITRTTPDIADLVAPGVLVVLQKDNLVLSKVYMNPTQLGPAIQNLFSNNEITQVGFTGALSKINSVLSAIGGLEPQSKTVLRGSKLWVTRIAVEADGVTFRFLSDRVNGMRYHATLRFPYADVLAAEPVIDVIADVLQTDPPFQLAPVASPEPTAVVPLMDEKEEIRRAAEAGNTDAMNRLGNVLAQNGSDVEAAQWFRQASERGHVKATNALGFMYEEGRGVPQDFEEAGRLYLQAMRKGNADSMVNRGLMYDKGRGVAASKMQAYVHFSLGAAYADDPALRGEAVKLRDEVAKQLTPAQLNAAQAEARKSAAQIKR